MVQRIRLSRARGWRLPPGAVNVARPGRWGNPFVVGRHGTRAECAIRFYSLVFGITSGDDPRHLDRQRNLHWLLTEHIGDLTGKDLACWCPLDGGPCHAEILLYLANAGHPAPVWLRGADEFVPRLDFD